MTKLLKYELNNGLKVFLYCDKKMHTASADIIVNFGGMNRKIIYNNKELKIKEGTAHFIEHLLIEKSIYGNALTYFFDNHVETNGLTSDLYTRYYVDCAKDFEIRLKELINVVNNHKFSKEDLEDIRPAILKEKMMSEDNKYRKYAKLRHDCLFKTYELPNTLGEVDDIKKINYEDVKLILKTFYQPNNQIIIISGNFDVKKIKNIILKEYEKYNSNVKFELPIYEEPKNVNKKNGKIKKDVYIDDVSISYKIYVGNLDPRTQLDLDFYFSIYLDNLFDMESNAYKKFKELQIGPGKIRYSYRKLYDYFVINVNTETSEHDRFVNLVTETLKNKKYDKEKFEIHKKRLIISILLRKDSLFNTIEPFIENFTFNYYDIDKVEDIEKMNFENFKTIIDSLDFSNYSVCKMIKEKNL